MRCVLEQNFIFVRRISVATLLIHYLLTYFTISHYTILHYTILYYIILNYSWGKRLCHACWKLMLESKIKQFYHPRSEDSLRSTHMINKGAFFGSLAAGFAFISRDFYFGTPPDDCFCHVKNIFLTNVIYMTTRDPFTAAKNPHRIGLKRYLMSRSSRVTNFFILICQNCPDQGGNSCSFKEKGSWLLPKFV